MSVEEVSLSCLGEPIPYIGLVPIKPRSIVKAWKNFWAKVTNRQTDRWTDADYHSLSSWRSQKKTLLLAKSDCVEMIVVRWVLNAIDHVSGHFYLVALFYGKCYPGPGLRAAHHTLLSWAGSQSILCCFWKCNHMKTKTNTSVLSDMKWQTNKLKCQFYLPTGAHKKTLQEWQILTFARMAKIENFFRPSSSQ